MAVMGVKNVKPNHIANTVFFCPKLWATAMGS